MVILEISAYFGYFRYLKGIWFILGVSGYFGYFRDFECIFGHFRDMGSIFGNFRGFRSIFCHFRGFGVFLVILEILRVFWSF